MGNRFLIEDALKEEFGADTKVVHKCGMPFTVASSIDGKRAKRECLPAYFNVPLPCSRVLCNAAAKKTAQNAKDIESAGGAPSGDAIER
mmetsp:Transcript_2612/g.5726  ORF Transcript_2612/g.5726 Transcript_2612/m.5726 type:complete len:89 (-) Transcript_2612:250-516(-)